MCEWLDIGFYVTILGVLRKQNNVIIAPRRSKKVQM